MCLLKLIRAMGTGSSLWHREDDDVLGTEYDSSQGVVKSIPNEVKPRPKLGGVRSVSKQKNHQNGSLRSALSVDMENVEVEKIRKEFEMYRLNKENEMASLRKKEQKLETENRRLRAELQSKEKTSQKQKEERDAALEAEHRALMRAAAIESDRDKIQHLFKIFRETKESELRNLLKAKQDLESKFAKLGASIYEDAETTSRLEAVSVFGNHGDWWATLDSEPSVGSLSHAHRSAFRGPEFMQHSIVDPEGLYVNINKDDWNAASANLAHVYPIIPDSLPVNVINVYVTASPDVQADVDALYERHFDQLLALCSNEGHLFNFVNLPSTEEEDVVFGQERQIRARCREIDRCTTYVAFIGNQIAKFAEMDVNYAYMKCPDNQKLIFCFKEFSIDENGAVRTVTGNSDLDLLRNKIMNGNKAMLLTYCDTDDGVERIYQELARSIRNELKMEEKKEDDEGGEYSCVGLEEPLLNWGTSVWDLHFDYEQIEAFQSACRSSCELGFEKYYEQLNSHVLAAGPVPPLLVHGASGSGKSLLLAKWIELQQYRSSGSLVLYHFVDCSTSSSADPILMIRRLTSQLMQHMNNTNTLTCDNELLVDEFPKWLEKVSSRMPGGIILVFDSMHRFQKPENHLKWLMDPLPVDLRIIVSVDMNRCPQAWKSWPSLVIEEMNSRSVKDLLCAELSTYGATLSTDQENVILTHCVTPSTRSPLYLVLLTSFISRSYSDRSTDSDLDQLMLTNDSVHLYKTLIERIICECDSVETCSLVEGILMAVYASRNGVSEYQLFRLFSDFTWNLWSPLCTILLDRLILRFKSGLLVFAHEQAREAFAEKFLSDEDNADKLQQMRLFLLDHHSQFIHPSQVSDQIADEYLWLNRQLENKVGLQEGLLNLSIFAKLFVRGRCSELISYWQFVGADKSKMAQAYVSAAKELEDGRCNGTVTLTSVADIYEAIGRFIMNHCVLNEAVTPLQRSFELRETSLDPDHPMIARSLHHLAVLHERQGKLMTAEALYKQALEIYEEALGKDHLLVGKEMDMLALLYQKQGKHDLVSLLHKRAVSIRKKSKVPQLTNTKSSETLKQKVQEFGDLTIVLPSIDMARTLNEVGVVHYLQSNFEDAEAMLLRSLEIRESLLKDNHPDIAQSLNNLAALYNDRKLYDKAAPLYERALEMRQKVFPTDHPGVTSIIKNLGILYKKIGHLDKAQLFYMKMVESKEKCFGSCHPTVATALVNLAVLYSQQGNHAAAEPLYERALKVYEDSLDPCHPRVSETLINMALLKYEQGDFEMAAQLYKRASEIKDNESVSNSKGISPHSSSIDAGAILRARTDVANDNYDD